ncbi:unnamed protein product, partial [Polarella glacialis]
LLVRPLQSTAEGGPQPSAIEDEKLAAAATQAGETSSARRKLEKASTIERYVQEKSIRQLLEGLAHSLMEDMPEDPRAFLAAQFAPVATAPAACTVARAEAASRAPGPASVEDRLRLILSEHPYLEADGPEAHPMWELLKTCRANLAAALPGEAEKNLAAISKEGLERADPVPELTANELGEAAAHLQRVISGQGEDMKQLAEAFKRFDIDGSGELGSLDTTEFQYLCRYLGFDEATNHEKVSLSDFELFVGQHGGLQKMFEVRRRNVARSRSDVFSAEHVAVSVGSRVRSYFYLGGKKSQRWQEAQVLSLGVLGCADAAGGAVLLEFGFGAGGSDGAGRWKARQTVPPGWILSTIEDAEIARALREVGILDEQQSFWAAVFPESEMRAIARLSSCQRAALAQVRQQASVSHERALPGLRESFARLGFGEAELQQVFSWVQDLAPVVVHIHIDSVGAFLESDGFYRNQFETHTSCGALDDGNQTRVGWERDLFGTGYDDAKPFERPKYGALSVMNDYRGVVSAQQYGDSYMVLKDVRLRCTFASTDSGGIAGSRLAVLDKYAHVLQEFNDDELKGLISVANATAAGGSPQLLRGSSADPTAEWITTGFPELKQQTGRWYFEMELSEGCETPQVGVVTTEFRQNPFAVSTEGVGDDAQGWGACGQHASKWHAGVRQAWGNVWNSDGQQLTERVVVGVAVDIDKKLLWICDGNVWGDKPTFEMSGLASGASLYPAVSMKGRGAYLFGACLQHAPPQLDGEDFQAWPSQHSGPVHVDCPGVGNSAILSIYKEVQIHGEVSLSRNVQRLVVNSKYRLLPKTARSWALNVSGAGVFSGCFRPAGVHCEMPLFRCSTGGTIIFWDSATSLWHIGRGEEPDVSASCFFAPAVEGGGCEPPRVDWNAPPERRGMVAACHFEAALGAMSQQLPLLATWRQTTPEGEVVIYRGTVQEEWAQVAEHTG